MGIRAEAPLAEVPLAEALLAEALLAEVLLAEVLPVEVLPVEVLLVEVLLAEVPRVAQFRLRRRPPRARCTFMAINGAGAQLQYLTNMVPPPGNTPGGAAPVTVNLTVASATSRQLTLHADPAVNAAARQPLTMTFGTGTDPSKFQQVTPALQFQPIQSSSGTTLTLSWDPDLHPGTYAVSVQVAPTSSPTSLVGKTVLFQVH